MPVTLRPVTPADAPALIAANAAARDFHAPWVQPFTDQPGFDTWWAPVDQGRRLPLIVLAAETLAGVISLNEIVRGAFQSSYLGYYAYPGSAGQGAMTRGLALALAHAFGPAGLHRVEANIQPANHRSLALVRRAGFRHEGFSPRYLHIDGAWRDHERSAKCADD
jgi:ribosomal-protein-alanine N-acetyltransferase